MRIYIRIFAAVLMLCTLLEAMGSYAYSAERVIVMRKDGKDLDGELISSDTDKLIVRGEGQKSIEIPWAEISNVSNGFTQEPMINRWKALNSAKLCPTCHACMR